jgi:hypothetical protein
MERDQQYLKLAQSRLGPPIWADVDDRPRGHEDSSVQVPVSHPGRGTIALVCLSGALGLLATACAYTAGRLNVRVWADWLFWSGLLLLFVPVAARLIGTSASRQERVRLVGILGAGLYVVKVFHSPLGFTQHDEFAHWRTVDDIITGGRLFSPNPIIPVSPFFPGLEIVTAAVSSTTGLSIFSAGVLVLGSARLVLVVGMYLFFEQITRSARAAGLAALVYMGNPNFLFFDAQFSYESLALTFASVALFAVAMRNSAAGSLRMGWTVIAVLACLAVVCTHHLTSYALVAFLGLWTTVVWIQPRLPFVRQAIEGADRTRRQGVAGIAALVLVASLVWLVYVASLTVGYLAPVLSAAVIQFVQLISGEVVARQLFRDFSGEIAPAWERLAGFGSVALILVVLPFAEMRLWRRHLASPPVLTIGLSALAYPASLALRLTFFGAETSNRASEFLFVALAVILGVWCVDLRPLAARWRRWTRGAVLTAGASVIFVGGVIVGWPRWGRIPGPYLVAADTRSIEPQGLGAADWARLTLGPARRIATDRINGLLMGSYGRQVTVRYTDDGRGLAWVFFGADLTESQRATLRDGKVQYVVVDRRLSSGLPLVGVYFEAGEPDAFAHTTPMDPVDTRKFDRLLEVNRVFDSGDIAVYDVSRLYDTTGSGGADAR